MKYLILSILALLSSTSFAEKVELCKDKGLFDYEKVPCQLDAEESLPILHGMMLSNKKFSSLVRKTGLENPSFEHYRVLVMGGKGKYGCGPGTGRSLTVYKVEMIVQSTDHGPTNGQEPHLLSVYWSIHGLGYYSEQEMVSKVKKLDWRDSFETLPVQEENSPLEKMLSKDLKSPCREKAN